MSVMTPILRIRKVLRSIGASAAYADEFADAMDAYPTRREFEQRMQAMFDRQFNRMLLAFIGVLAVSLTVYGLINALVD